MDSGADDNLIDKQLASDHHIPLELLDEPCTILDLNGRPIATLHTASTHTYDIRKPPGADFPFPHSLLGSSSNVGTPLLSTL